VKLPARTYTVERGGERYSVTVVDYTVAERAHTERANNCEVGAQNLCAGNGTVAQGVGAWKYDVLGALDHASQEFLTRDAKVTYFAWSSIDRINGRDIHLSGREWALGAICRQLPELVSPTEARGAGGTRLMHESRRVAPYNCHGAYLMERP